MALFQSLPEQLRAKRHNLRVRAFVKDFCIRKGINLSDVLEQALVDQYGQEILAECQDVKELMQQHKAELLHHLKRESPILRLFGIVD